MSGDVRLAFNGSWCADGFQTSWTGRWRAVGEHGSATWDGEGTPRVEPGPGVHSRAVAPVRQSRPPRHRFEGLAGALAEFVAALRTGRAPQSGPTTTCAAWGCATRRSSRRQPGAGRVAVGRPERRGRRLVRMSQADRQEATHRHVRRAAHLIASQLSDRPAIAIGTLAGALGVSEPDAAALVRAGALGESSEMFGEWRVTVVGYEAYRRRCGPFAAGGGGRAVSRARRLRRRPSRRAGGVPALRAARRRLSPLNAAEYPPVHEPDPGEPLEPKPRELTMRDGRKVKLRIPGLPRPRSPGAPRSVAAPSRRAPIPGRSSTRTTSAPDVAVGAPVTPSCRRAPRSARRCAVARRTAGRVVHRVRHRLHLDAVVVEDRAAAHVGVALVDGGVDVGAATCLSQCPLVVAATPGRTASVTSTSARNSPRPL